MTTDHKPLLGLLAGDKLALQIMSLQMIRWSVFLSAYSYTLLYVPGKDLAHADALSRCPLPVLLENPAPASSVLCIDSVKLTVTAADVTHVSAKNPEISTVLDWV